MAIDISGLDKAEVLAALYNYAGPVGLGFLDYKPGDMTVEEARDLLNRRTYFDYVKGRVMKVNLSGNEFEEWLYDRDNGKGAAAEAIAPLRKGI